ncbi:universal stress protein [Halopiger aswanensis]|uniref:Nucleotide-binding universal stress UspA family protein n=1 Tax=Halopiger aswanensis TaxID=148449 RepID=A0A3R7FT60_9EURY|nr:universal stress protein [Halopiger aswanensis]RKD88663.1 nucleotide-binding universal stress UspA family protein [Halopiger aswanensis]
MGGHVLVVISRTSPSTDILEYAFQKYPNAKITVIHVTAARSSFDPFRNRDPCEYVIPELDSERNEELLPAPDLFTRAQQKRAENVFSRAHELAERYDKEIESVVRSGDETEEVVTYAENHAVDRIIIAEHLSLRLPFFHRNVSKSMAHTTDIPVTTR